MNIITKLTNFLLWFRFRKTVERLWTWEKFDYEKNAYLYLVIYCPECGEEITLTEYDWMQGVVGCPNCEEFIYFDDSDVKDKYDSKYKNQR